MSMGTSRLREGAKEELMAEYNHLRQEILNSHGITMQIMTFTTVLVGVLMGFAFSNEVTDYTLKALLFMLAGIIGIIGYVQDGDRMRSVYMIGSYIKTFIEPDLTYIQWETRLPEFRTTAPRSTRTHRFFHQRLIYIILIGGNFGLVAYSVGSHGLQY